MTFPRNLTMSRWENAPDLRTLIRVTHAMMDPWCNSYRRPPKAITLEIDDTDDTVHGHQLSLFNADHDERCFRPIHVDGGHGVVTILCPGKTPDGKEVRAHLRRLVRRIRLHWPNTAITVRGDSHYGGWEAMEWCEQIAVQYVFGLAQNTVLGTLVQNSTVAVNARLEVTSMAMVRNYTETLYATQSWSCPRHVAARIEATYEGLDTVVTNIAHCGPQWLYDSLYCTRGQVENLIKRHKSQLASDRTSCRSPLATQMRLILHTAAYWLMLAVRNVIPRPQAVGQRRILHHPAGAVEGRRADQRNREPGDASIRCQLPGCSVEMRRIGDAVMGAFFGAASDRARRERRGERADACRATGTVWFDKVEGFANVPRADGTPRDIWTG
jgi:hypothetical protein